MNTLAHLAAVIASIWLLLYGFLTLEQPLLGIVAVFLTALFATLTLFAAQSDWRIIRGGERQ